MTILYLIVNMSSYTLIINGDFYEKAQKNLRRFEKFYSNPRNASPRKDSSVFSYSEVMDISGQITSSKDWQNGFYSEGSTRKKIEMKGLEAVSGDQS